MAHTLKMVANAAWSGFCDSHSVTEQCTFLFTMGTEQCTYSHLALSSAPIHIWHWAVHLNTIGTEQCTFSQWALNNAPIHNLHWAVHLHTIDRQCICSVDNVDTMLTISLTHNTAECAGSTHTVHLFKARVREDRVTSAG